MRKLLFVLLLGFVLPLSSEAQTGPVTNLPPKKSGDGSLVQRSSTTTDASTLKSQAQVVEVQIPTKSMSEYFYQSANKQTAISLAPKMLFQAEQYSQGSFKARSDRSKAQLQMAIERGFTSNVALEFETSVGQEELYGNSKTLTSSGLGDLLLKVKGRSETQNFVFGTSLNFSPEEVKYPSAQERGNLYSGNNFIKPYVGYQAQISSISLGSLFSYQVNGERREQYPSGTSVTTTGGNISSLYGFLETHKEKFMAGGSIGASLFEARNLRGVAAIKPYSMVHASFYAKFTLNSQLELKPVVEYSTRTERNFEGNINADQFDVTTVQMVGRFIL